jgi:hypothetical protein
MSFALVAHSHATLAEASVRRMNGKGDPNGVSPLNAMWVSEPSAFVGN